MNTRIGILGCAGRMGRMLLAEVLATADATLSAGSERPGADGVGRDLGELAGSGPIGVKCIDDAGALMKACDIAIDFTSAKAAIIHAKLAAEAGTALVIGTTGLESEAAQIEEAAKRIPIVWAPNMSVGVTVMLALAEQMARVLDPDYDIEIVEMHHRHKVDAPSGTALGLGRAVAKGRNIPLDSVWQKVRDGITGPRKKGDIGFATLRGGDVVGEHSLIFAGEGERLELVHKASSRRVFSSGAVRAAKWVKGKKPGVYAMRDVLGLG